MFRLIGSVGDVHGVEASEDVVAEGPAGRHGGLVNCVEVFGLFSSDDDDSQVFLQHLSDLRNGGSSLSHPNGLFLDEGARNDVLPPLRSIRVSENGFALANGDDVIVVIESGKTTAEEVPCFVINDKLDGSCSFLEEAVVAGFASGLSFGDPLDSFADDEVANCKSSSFELQRCRTSSRLRGSYWVRNQGNELR